MTARWIRLGLWLAIFCLSAPVSAVDNAPGGALGPPIAGKFESLTDQIFPTAQHHLSDRLSLIDYYKWKRNLSAKHGIDFALLNTPIFQVGSEDGGSQIGGNEFFEKPIKIHEMIETIERILGDQPLQAHRIIAGHGKNSNRQPEEELNVELESLFECVDHNLIAASDGLLIHLDLGFIC